MSNFEDNLNGIEGFLENCFDSCTLAFDERELYPMRRLIINSSDSLEELGDVTPPDVYLLRLFGSNRQIEVVKPNLKAVRKFIVKYAPSLSWWNRRFSYLEKIIQKDIKIEPVPREIGSIYCVVFTAKGLLVMPYALDGTVKHYGFAFSLDVSTEVVDRPVEFNLANERGYSSSKAALSDLVGDFGNQTVLVACNTEVYPLQGTVFPIIGEKYKTMIGGSIQGRTDNKIAQA